jgi:hypothetical protein
MQRSQSNTWANFACLFLCVFAFNDLFVNPNCWLSQRPQREMQRSQSNTWANFACLLHETGSSDFVSWEGCSWPGEYVFSANSKKPTTIGKKIKVITMIY